MMVDHGKRTERLDTADTVLISPEKLAEAATHGYTVKALRELLGINFVTAPTQPLQAMASASEPRFTFVASSDTCPICNRRHTW